MESKDQFKSNLNKYIELAKPVSIVRTSAGAIGQKVNVVNSDGSISEATAATELSAGSNVLTKNKDGSAYVFDRQQTNTKSSEIAQIRRRKGQKKQEDLEFKTPVLFTRQYPDRYELWIRPIDQDPFMIDAIYASSVPQLPLIYSRVPFSWSPPSEVLSNYSEEINSYVGPNIISSSGYAEGSYSPNPDIWYDRGGVTIDGHYVVDVTFNIPWTITSASVTVSLQISGTTEGQSQCGIRIESIPLWWGYSQIFDYIRYMPPSGPFYSNTAYDSSLSGGVNKTITNNYGSSSYTAGRYLIIIIPSTGFNVFNAISYGYSGGTGRVSYSANIQFTPALPIKQPQLIRTTLSVWEDGPDLMYGVSHLRWMIEDGSDTINDYKLLDYITIKNYNDPWDWQSEGQNPIDGIWGPTIYIDVPDQDWRKSAIDFREEADVPSSGDPTVDSYRFDEGVNIQDGEVYRVDFSSLSPLETTDQPFTATVEDVDSELEIASIEPNAGYTTKIRGIVPLKIEE